MTWISNLRCQFLGKGGPSQRLPSRAQHHGDASRVVNGLFLWDIWVASGQLWSERSKHPPDRRGPKLQRNDRFQHLTHAARFVDEFGGGSGSHLRP